MVLAGTAVADGGGLLPGSGVLDGGHGLVAPAGEGGPDEEDGDEGDNGAASNAQKQAGEQPGKIAVAGSRPRRLMGHLLRRIGGEPLLGVQGIRMHPVRRRVLQPEGPGVEHRRLRRRRLRGVFAGGADDADGHGALPDQAREVHGVREQRLRGLRGSVFAQLHLQNLGVSAVVDPGLQLLAAGEDHVDLGDVGRLAGYSAAEVNPDDAIWGLDELHGEDAGGGDEEAAVERLLSKIARSHEEGEPQPGPFPSAGRGGEGEVRREARPPPKGQAPPVDDSPFAPLRPGSGDSHRRVDDLGIPVEGDVWFGERLE